MKHSLDIINFKPGVQLDGTQINTDSCISGVWNRWFQGTPTKMGGIQFLCPGLVEIVRTLFCANKSTSCDIYAGRPSSVVAMNLVNGTNVTQQYNRTPATYLTDFGNNVTNNIWTFAINNQTNILTAGNPRTNLIFAHAAPNLVNINSSEEGRLYYGAVNSTLPFVLVEQANVTTQLYGSGGIVSSDPYLIEYGNFVAWSEPNNPLVFPEANIYIPLEKVLYGAAVQYGGAPCIYLWTASQLIKMQFVGGKGEFTFTPFPDQISVLSSRSIVRYNDMFFWIGTDCFYVFDGNRIQVLANTMNFKFFFSNVNMIQRQKIFGIANLKFNEITWHFPSGSNVENSLFISLNAQGNFWFNGSIPGGGGRSAGLQQSTLNTYPIYSDTNLVQSATRPTPDAPIWLHEIGNDLVDESMTAFPILASFQTKYYMLGASGKSEDKQCRILQIQPDFVLQGKMTVNVSVRSYANSEDISSDLMVFDSGTPFVTMNIQGRFFSFEFVSNTLGGTYQMGNIYYNYMPGDQGFFGT